MRRWGLHPASRSSGFFALLRVLCRVRVAPVPPAYARRLALLVLLVVLVFAMRASGLHIVCLRRAARAVLDAVGP